MRSRKFDTLQRQRGYTLMEILVAVAIFVTVMIVALLLYDQSNRVFKQSNEAAEMQQNTRVAYEKVVADLRMAGFDYKRAGTPAAGLPTAWAPDRDYSIGSMVTPTTPNGHVYRCITAGRSAASAAGEPVWSKTTGATINDKAPLQWQESGVPVYEQPDEQIEFAHTKAITIRGNFDYEDPSTADKGRETVLETSTGFRFPVVTTGNDEIVTYALVSRSSNANANKGTVSFFADVNAEGTAPARKSYPGGAAEREIKITGVDLTNLYPPYTLMRYTLGDDGKVVATALADNIRSMEFAYWQDAQAKDVLLDLDDKPVTDVGGAGAYDPSKPNDVIAGRLIRGRIRAVTATIVGMSPQPDPKYTHPTDTVAKNFRQYSLKSTIVGRNLGVKGVPQSSTNPPGAPTISSSCNGYCGVVVLLWNPAPGTVDTTYTVLWDTSPSGSFSKVLPAGTQTTYAVDLTQEDLTQTYYFRVAATNEAGTTMSTNTIAVSPKNATKPAAPAITAVSGGAAGAARENEIEIFWTSPTANATGAPSCSPSGTPPIATAAAELKGYRIWRSMTAGFNPGDAGSQLVVDVNTPGPITDGSGTWRYTDKNVANCENYYYRVQAVEWCSANSAMNASGDINTALSAVSPEMLGKASSAKKAKAPANFKVTPDSVCDATSNQCFPVRMTWNPVTQNLQNEPVVVLDYLIYRQQKKMGVNVGTKTLAGSISDGSTTFSEPSALQEHDPLVPTLKYSYEYTVVATYCSLDGNAATLTFPGACTTGATIAPDGGQSGSGTNADPYRDVETLQVIPYTGKPVTGVEVQVDNGTYTTLAPPYVLPWSDTADGQMHTVNFRVSVAGCTEVFPVVVQNDPPPCAVEVTVGNTPGLATQLEVFIKNVSTTKIVMDRFDISWTAQTGFSWNGIQLPSNATMTATGTANATRTAEFAPAANADKSIDPGATLRVRMNLTGTGYANAANVTNVRVLYKQATTPPSAQINCLAAIARCQVSATATLSTTTTFTVAITNNSAEELSVDKIGITWNSQNKWGWESITVSGQTINVIGAAGGGTETFTPTNVKIAAGNTLNVTMNMKVTGNNPAALTVGNVGIVTMEYKTPISNNVALKCRAK